MTTSEVTVIVPTFNRASYINECIDSLLAQSVPAREIIVVDDGSDDDTAARVARYGNRVRYVRKDNGGKPSAVNLALNQARGDWIWLFDDDDVASPDAIEARLSVLCRDPGLGFVYAPHYMGTSGPDGRIVRGRVNDLSPPPPEALHLTLMRSAFCSLSSVIFRRELSLQLGGLDPSLVAGEDYDFLIRLAGLARGAFCDRPVFIVRQHTGTRGPKSERYAERDRARIFLRYSKAIGQKIRLTQPLGAFCVPSASECNAAQSCEALLNRALVMANHGCVDELIADVDAFLCAVETGPRIAYQARAAISEILQTGWAYDSCTNDWQRFVRKAGALRARNGGRGAILALAKGALKRATSYPGTLADRMLRLRRAGSLAWAALR